MSLKGYVEDNYRVMLQRAAQFIEDHNLTNLIAPVIWCFETYPLLSVVLFFLLVTYSIPVCLFLAFFVISLLITLTGFLVIEGTVLGIAFILLLSVLSILTITLGSVLFICWLMYIAISQICEIFLPDLMVQVNIPPPPPSQLHNYNHRHLHQIAE